MLVFCLPQWQVLLQQLPRDGMLLLYRGSQDYLWAYLESQNFNFEEDLTQIRKVKEFALLTSKTLMICLTFCPCGTLFFSTITTHLSPIVQHSRVPILTLLRARCIENFWVSSLEQLSYSFNDHALILHLVPF